jgi:hypothetical protein
VVIRAFDKRATASSTPVTLVLRDGVHDNTPTIAVSGACIVTLKGLKIRHGAGGNDIWGGNSAIHIDPDTSDTTHTHNAINVTIDACDIR